MRKTLSRRLLSVALALLAPVIANSATSPSVPRDFKSDGCSLFTDGNLEQRDLWCACRFVHDIAYWQGAPGKSARRPMRHFATVTIGDYWVTIGDYWGQTLELTFRGSRDSLPSCHGNLASNIQARFTM